MRDDPDQLHFEEKRRIRPDVGTRAALAVSEIRRNGELIFRASLHQLKRFGPTFNHTINRKRSRFAPLK